MYVGGTPGSCDKLPTQSLSLFQRYGLGLGLPSLSLSLNQPAGQISSSYVILQTTPSSAIKHVISLRLCSHLQTRHIAASRLRIKNRVA